MAFNFDFKDWQKIRDYFDEQRKPSKRRVMGVACGTVFMALSLDVLFLQGLPWDKIFSVAEEEPSIPPLPAKFEDFVDKDKNPVGRLLTERERERILLILGKPSTTPFGFVPGRPPLFIVHDTAGELDNATLEAQKEYNRGPLGDGIAAYVPKQGESIMTRSVFFTPNRPTGTAYERAFDLMPEAERSRSLRTVWHTLNLSSRQTHLQNAIAAIDPSLVTFTNRAALWLNSSSDSAFDAWQRKNMSSLDGAKTTAIWAIGQLCSNVVTEPNLVNSLAQSPNHAKQLLQTCQKVAPVLQEYRTRVATSVNVELVQKRGSDCFTTDAQVRTYNGFNGAITIPENRAIPLINENGEVYTESQYEALANLYLQAALHSGRFPEVVTHYWLDQGLGKVIGDHCDPRGLNLTEVYTRISTALGHPEGTIYGIIPQYGQNPQQGDNVWWAESIVGTKPPLMDNQSVVSVP
ncbi:MAG: hypothetical protein VKJ02_00470 [Snowella sp.]|nr:hypothetical protein [Snowella sp.]